MIIATVIRERFRFVVFFRHPQGQKELHGKAGIVDVAEAMSSRPRSVSGVIEKSATEYGA